MAKKKSILHTPIDLKVFAIIVLAIALGIAVWGLNNERNMANQSEAASNAPCSIQRKDCERQCGFNQQDIGGCKARCRAEYGKCVLSMH